MTGAAVRASKKICGPHCCLTIETTVFRIVRDGAKPENHIVPVEVAPERDMSDWF